VLAWSAVAVASRLLVSWASADSGIFADMEQYHARAVHLARSGTLFPDALRGPGYPALLAVAYRLGGESFWSARVANALVAGGLTLLTGWLALRSGAGARAWVAAAIVAVYPALVLSSVYLMPEGLYTLFAVLALLLMTYPSPRVAATAGAATELAMLTRSVGLTLVAASLSLAAWAVLRHRDRPQVALRRVAMFLGACGLVLLPWLLFTSRVAGGPLLDSASGLNVLLGNHPRATGRLNLEDGLPLRQAYMDGAVDAADANARALRAGLAWARDNPGAWLRLSVAKLGYLMGLEGREHAWGYSSGYFGPRRSLTVTVWGVLLLLSFPALVLAAASGVARAHGSVDAPHVAMGAFFVATCVLHVISFGESRFHLPLVPVFAVAASLGSGPLAASSRRRTARIAAAVALLAIGWWSQAPELLRALARLRAADGWMANLPY
jgi:4-amino-4-deoxy-L-arabinose transferase-like glycosyltransferase